MRAFIEPLKIRRVKVRALTPNFYLNGHQAQVGEEGIMDFSDASYLIAASKAELVSEEPARTIAARDLQDPLPLRRLV
ncbi:MAG: hypothetical protein A2Z40_03600 [Deltaproteobacteria bacterium RBG_19FT_COMBO_60_16]|nr:MAG: hypothetical protein A2Z40_03600 [Deltaproteobacteria bacterium RBG_19FT_COMBO_60_16]